MTFITQSFRFTYKGSLLSTGVSDFNVAEDSIGLDNKYRTKLGSEASAKPAKLSTRPPVGSKAHDATDRVTYDQMTGALLRCRRDRMTAQVKIAVPEAGLKLASTSFFVI